MSLPRRVWWWFRRLFGSGQKFYVGCPTVSGSKGRCATLEEAIGNCVEGRGDMIVVLSGHVEMLDRPLNIAVGHVALAGVQ